MSILDDIRRFLEERELSVEASNEEVYGTHTSIPVSITIGIGGDDIVEIRLEAGDDLRDALIELIESGEDVRGIVDDVLSELRDTAIELQKMLEDKGYRVEISLREGENDVKDILDEVIEEYRDMIEEVEEEEY